MAQQDKNAVSFKIEDKHLKNSDIFYIIKDALAGDQKALESPEFTSLNIKNVQKAIEWLQKADDIDPSFKSLLAAEGWRLTYRRKPPTPEEFLTKDYIGEQADSLWPPVEKAFKEFMNPLMPYRTLVLSVSIGWGKSLLSVLVQLYLATLYGMMWRPYAYFGLAPSTQFCLFDACFTQGKASSLLMEPMMKLFEKAPFFEKVKYNDELIEAQEADPLCTKMYWTTAGKTSPVTFRGGLNVKLASDEMDIIGQTILCETFTELGWFKKAGWSDDQIFTFFAKGKQRVASRMKGNYFGRVIIDSSPYSLESPIDEWIYTEAYKSNENYLVTGSRWKHYPKEFPRFIVNGEEQHNFNVGFPIYLGNGKGSSAKVIEGEGELQMYDPIDIIWCPKYQETTQGIRNMLTDARLNVNEFLRDWGGIPAGSANRLLSDPQVIEDCFDNNLKNIYNSIESDYKDEPEHLIWDKIKNIFFMEIVGKWYFYREPAAARVMSIDQSVTGDATGIAISHIEYSKDGSGNVHTEYVTDMTIVIIPKGGRINLDSIRYFIFDLIDLGNIDLRYVSFDQFQSEATKQAVMRRGIKFEYVTVDKKNEPYTLLVDAIEHGRYHCGKNLHMKNNLKSLQKVERDSGKSWKYDHMNGPLVHSSDNLDWATSKIGMNAKDCADAVAANVFLLNEHNTEISFASEWTKDSNSNSISISSKMNERGFSF